MKKVLYLIVVLGLALMLPACAGTRAGDGGNDTAVERGATDDQAAGDEKNAPKAKGDGPTYKYDWHRNWYDRSWPTGGQQR